MSPERSVLITGAAGGLGGAVVQAFADAGGWRVVGTDRVAPASTPAEFVVADLFDVTEVGRAVAQAADGPPLRAVVNLVGGFAAGGRVHETPVEEFETQLRLNLRPTYLVTAAALPHLLDGGGSVVCVSSRAALEPFPGLPATSPGRPRFWHS